LPAPHKLLPYPCPICDGKFGTAQIVILNGILRHGSKHPDSILESKEYARERKSFLDSVQRRDEPLYTCHKNKLLFRIYHYSSENYNDIKKRMEMTEYQIKNEWKPWKKKPKEIKKAYGKEVHSFRTGYEIRRIFYYGSDAREYSIPVQDIFLAPDLFNLKRNQRSRSWALNENSKGEFKKLYEMIREDGWYYKEPMPGVLPLFYRCLRHWTHFLLL
jgi:hypothetical protein